MTITGKQQGIAVGLAANALCWLLFLLQAPVSSTELAARDAVLRAGNFDRLSSEPLLVVSREVPMSASEDPLLFTYECVSLPGAFLGFQINDLVWNTFAANHNPWLLARTEWIWTSRAGRSWLLGWALFIGTSAWWGLLGWGAATAHKRLRRRTREVGDNTEPDNKALQVKAGVVQAMPGSAVDESPGPGPVARRGAADCLPLS